MSNIKEINCKRCGKKILVRNLKKEYCLVCRKKVNYELVRKWQKNNKDKAKEIRENQQKKYKEKYGCTPSNNWQKNNKKKVAEYNKKYRSTKQWRKKQSTRERTRRLLKARGIELFRINCEICGMVCEEVHHNDYNNPYDIMYLCKKCHRGLHKLLIKEKQNENYHHSKM